MKSKLLALAIAAVFVLGGGLTALSYASTAQVNSPKPPTKQQSVSATTDKSKEVTDASETDGKDSAALQEKAEEGNEVKDANEASEHKSAAEKKAEEQEDKNLPGGGHQDPDGANVEHQFEGVE